MDGSKRSNARMCDHGSNKRIVLFDSLITLMHGSEILAILSWELR